MMMYDNEYQSHGFLFRCGKMTTTSKLGIFLNLEDENILDLINNNPEKLSDCLKQIIPCVFFNQAHQKMYRIADEDGHRRYGYNQWEEYIGSCHYQKLSKLKRQAEMVLERQDDCNPRAINNAKIVLECLKGNFPARWVRKKSPEEVAKENFARKRDKIRLKLTIELGYKCDQCEKCEEGSLCIVRKDDTVLNYELSNLLLRCRSCMNKMKNKS